MASTEAEYIEVLIGGSGWEELQRRGIHTLVQRILRTRHECLGTVYHQDTRKKCGKTGWLFSRQKPPRHRCGHFPKFTKRHCDGPSIPGENSIGRFKRQHGGTRCQITRHAQPYVISSFAEVSAVVPWHRVAAALKTEKKQLTVPIGWGTPQDKSEHRSGNHHDDNL